ncbi:EF-P beta-lysylation protein EpmB [Methylomonas methanica]|uniref:L-lysine 2,3-aminomutase n=1 Tax=Methylomonas methanica (strain DSM 25384 / MC09) TaxID=857087 RepID=F9ZWU9_METMM|nr:EF-P beta-lysylation protein EpmB [Methylomonas methanica]AEG02111.1 lysine-2,3-aminomutase-related protein [Methylomonas methanica MC09]
MNTHLPLWQRQLAEAFSSVADLCRYLQLDPASLPLLPHCKDFALRVPRGFADCMVAGDPNDPLLRQILPLQDELEHYPGFSHDPVGDLNAVAEAGVIHKYQGRVLLICTGACAINCRYCFRRHFPYADQQLSKQKLQQALTYIAARPEISEVILSGGDPLLLKDDKLSYLLEAVSEISHVRRIRIHSRIPVVLPARVNPDLLETLHKLPQPVVLVLHANHANELSEEVANACRSLKQQNVTLLNQSVLLQGINDDSQTLLQLNEKLFSLGVLPYYLHCLDRAKGVGHFEVPEKQALALMQSLQEQLPGYLVPKLVKEQAGAAHKIRLA